MRFESRVLSCRRPGESVAAFARRCGVSRDTVSAWVSHVMGRGGYVLGQQHAKCHRVADALGVDPQWLCVDSQPTVRDDVLDLRGDGESLSDFARRIGVSRQLVDFWQRRLRQGRNCRLQRKTLDAMANRLSAISDKGRECGEDGEEGECGEEGR
jgi:transposase-like protein